MLILIAVTSPEKITDSETQKKKHEEGSVMGDGNGRSGIRVKIFTLRQACAPRPTRVYLHTVRKQAITLRLGLSKSVGCARRTLKGRRRILIMPSSSSLSDVNLIIETEERFCRTPATHMGFALFTWPGGSSQIFSSCSDTKATKLFHLSQR
jgi:hypothetical protein